MKYQSLLLPAHDRMGVLMRRDDPLADRRRWNRRICGTGG